MSSSKEEFDWSQLVLYKDKKLGSGSNAQVHKGSYKNQPVAVKFYREVKEEELESMQTDFRREVSTLSKLNSNNVVKILASNFDNLTIVEELIDGKTLNSTPRSNLSLKRSFELGLQIAQTMAYIHHEHIIHRDLNPDNIMLSKDGIIKIIDFGWAREEAGCMTPNAGTEMYNPPEIITDDDETNISYNNKVDVFSFSMVLWELITGVHPCRHNKNETPDQVWGGWLNVPDYAQELLKQYWSTNAHEIRPSFEDISAQLKIFLAKLGE